MNAPSSRAVELVLDHILDRVRAYREVEQHNLAVEIINTLGESLS